MKTKCLGVLLVLLVLVLHAASAKAGPSFWLKSPASVRALIETNPTAALDLLQLYVRGYADGWIWASVEHKGSVAATKPLVDCVGELNLGHVALDAAVDETSESYAGAVQTILDQECWQ